MRLHFLILIFATPSIQSATSYRTTFKNYEVLRVTSKSHHDSIIFKEIASAHQSMLPLSPYTASRQCVQNSYITYHTKDLQMIYEDLEASECRLNINDKFLAIINPTTQVHLKLHEEMLRKRNPLLTEIEQVIMFKFEDYPNPKFHIPFYSFNDNQLNYDLDCPIKYFDIAQVKFRQLSLEVKLEKSIKIAPSCGFKFLDPEFDGSFSSIEVLNIPINGTFHCVNGRTSTCKRSIAQVAQAHYRIPE